jgi:type II secretory pathway component PulF
VCGVAWLPFLGLIALVVPKFDALFSRLREDAEVPAVTEWLLWFTSVNKTLFLVPCLLVLVLLVAADVGMAGLLRHSRREWLYRVWFVGVIAMGILAAVFVAIGLLLPVLKMSESG